MKIIIECYVKEEELAVSIIEDINIMKKKYANWKNINAEIRVVDRGRQHNDALLS